MLTQRLGSKTQMNPKFIEALIKEIKAHTGSCDEVWLASSYGFPKLEEHKKTADCLCSIAEKFRAENIRVSLQISNTIGHGRYMSSCDCSGLVYDGSPIEKMVGPDGNKAEYCFCWRGRHFLEYIDAEIREYARIKPYAVWMDDDLRANNHDPVSFGCFCDDCMAEFNRLWDSNFTREELVKEINYGNLIWRERYIQFVREGLHDFTLGVAKALHEISPESAMGYQYCANGAYTGYDYSFIFDAMREGTGKAPLSRPGGGAYDDRNLNAFVDKMWFINWANYMLPDYVKEIRPEIENLPDVRFGKSIAGTCFETSLYFAGGATAMSYALLMNDYEPMKWHGEMLGAFAGHRRYWEALSRANAGTTQAGIKLCTSRNYWAKNLKTNEPWFAYNNEPPARPNMLLYCGVPVCFGNEKSPVYMLTSDTAERLSDDEVKQLMSCPVLTDGKSLDILIKRGFDFGIETYQVDTTQLYERYIDHPLLKGYENKHWSQSFSFRSGYALTKLDKCIEPFAYYTTDSLNAVQTEPGNVYPYGIADVFLTTSEGAKWAVFGHTPWNANISLDKRNLLLLACDYISGRRLPAILETGISALLLPRENTDGKVTSVSVVNFTAGESGDLKLRIRRPLSEKFHCMRADGEYHPEFSRDGSDYILTLKSLPAFGQCTVFIY